MQIMVNTFSDNFHGQAIDRITMTCLIYSHCGPSLAQICSLPQRDRIQDQHQEGVQSEFRPIEYNRRHSVEMPVEFVAIIISSSFNF